MVAVDVFTHRTNHFAESPSKCKRRSLRLCKRSCHSRLFPLSFRDSRRAATRVLSSSAAGGFHRRLKARFRRDTQANFPFDETPESAHQAGLFRLVERTWSAAA